MYIINIWEIAQFSNTWNRREFENMNIFSGICSIGTQPRFVMETNRRIAKVPHLTDFFNCCKSDINGHQRQRHY
jgi:hypothetical protein